MRVCEGGKAKRVCRGEEGGVRRGEGYKVKRESNKEGCEGEKKMRRY